MSKRDMGDGYAWAAFQLLSGSKTPEAIEDQISEHHDDFDRGACNALIAWAGVIEKYTNLRKAMSHLRDMADSRAPDIYAIRHFITRALSENQ
jgi:hypothetical protein